MKFEEAESFLLHRRRLGMKFGLANMGRALSLLGRPERGLPAVLVAGSKGKGSFCALLESILLEAGYPVGLYTSPHLVSVTERIRVAGRPIGRKAFGDLVESVRDLLGGGGPPLTYFEWLTLMALKHFRDTEVPLALLEVGLGGRLDATNVVPATMAVVTEIEKEHTEYLGHRLGDIAREKGGVMKRGAVVLSGVTSPTARRAITSVARSRGAVLRHLLPEASWHVRSHTWRGLRMDLQAGGEQWRGLRVGLAGRHQAHNAALAVRAAGELKALGFTVGKRHIRRGLAGARWPGRCDFRAGRPAWFLDGAHTLSSARALAAALEELFPSRRRVLLFGALRDKKLPLLADTLFPGSGAVVLVRPPDERGAEPDEMLRRLPRRLREGCLVAGGVAEGMDLAAAAAGAAGIVVATGSLFLVGAVLGRLEGSLHHEMS